MVDIVRGVLKEFPVVLFLDGTLSKPKSRLSERVVRELDAQGLTFKALKGLDISYGPWIGHRLQRRQGEPCHPADRTRHFGL